MNRLLTTMGVLVVLSASTAHGTLTSDQAQQLFGQGNAAFRRAHGEAETSTQSEAYRQAILAFERLIREGGIENAKLYYNVANAYLLKGDLGRAIANYRRAERLDPSDRNILKNLTYAQSQRVDTVAVPTDRRVRQMLFFWHYDFSTEGRFYFACACFGLLCLATTGMVWRGRHAAFTTTAVIVSLLWVATAGSVFVETVKERDTIYGVITADEIVARQGDGTNYPESFKAPLHAGTEFTLLEERAGWWRIRLADDSEGWIPDTAAIEI